MFSQCNFDQEKVTNVSTEAVAHKQQENWDGAIHSMMKAYEIAAKYPLNHIHVDYLRLPQYLHASGHTDEAWTWLEKLSQGHLPGGKDETWLQRSLSWRQKIEDKRSLLLEQEENFGEAFIWRCSSTFFGKSSSSVWAARYQEQINTQSWSQAPNDPLHEDIRLMRKKRIFESLASAKRLCNEQSLEWVFDEIWKTGKKAEFDKSAVENAALYIHTKAVKQVNEEQTCLQAVQIIRKASELISATKQLF